MRSIERRFANIQKKNQGYSSYVCFAKAVTEQKFSREAIHQQFNKLVEKDDYTKSDKKAILVHLQTLTNAVTTPENSTKSHA